jgi:FAD/FMN-containing dehydrogenase
VYDSSTPEAVVKIDGLEKQLRGTVLLPGSEEYEASRRIWNAMIDRRPRAIVCCSGPADVQAAVRFAAQEEIYPAIRGGGHNAAGLAMLDDGLVIDVSRMKGIFVEPAARTVTAQTGLTWGEFDRETHVHGLATTGGLISTTGIAGLTLGGGVGWLMGRCGLVCDNTLNYDVVLASGEMVRANASENADLFWALRGGGGNSAWSHPSLIACIPFKKSCQDCCSFRSARHGKYSGFIAISRPAAFPTS